MGRRNAGCSVGGFGTRRLSTTPDRRRETGRQSPCCRSSLTTALGDAGADDLADRGSTPRTSTRRSQRLLHRSLPSQTPAASTLWTRGRIRMRILQLCFIWNTHQPQLKSNLNASGTVWARALCCFRIESKADWVAPSTCSQRAPRGWFSGGTGPGMTLVEKMQRPEKHGHSSFSKEQTSRLRHRSGSIPMVYSRNRRSLPLTSMHGPS